MESRRPKWRRLVWPAGLLVALLAVVGVARIPVTTEQGVNWVVTSYRIPLYAKALDFVERADNYGRLAARVTGGEPDETARALKLFDWTEANIRNRPESFPVVDDHVWHIVIRGYGEPDQRADVFTTLASYAGLRAYYLALHVSAREALLISLVQVDGRWRMFDTTNGLVFRTRQEQLATPEDIAADPTLIVQNAGAGRTYGGHPYSAYFNGFKPPAPPDITRPEMQMLWPRLWYQIKHPGRRAAGQLPVGVLSQDAS